MGARKADAAAIGREPGAICRKDGDCRSGLCGAPDRTRRRRCRCRTDADCPPAPAGKPCVEITCRAGVCAGVATPVDCVVSDWGGWSACSADCGGGTQTRTRSIVTPASCGGNACPTTTDSQPCNPQACGTCDATQAAAFCSTVTAVDGTVHCGRPGFGPSCCDTDADCAANGLSCTNVVPQFCATTSQLGTSAPTAEICVADAGKAGVCCCLAACDIPT
jgi:hypothetical protein